MVSPNTVMHALQMKIIVCVKMVISTTYWNSQMTSIWIMLPIEGSLLPNCWLQLHEAYNKLLHYYKAKKDRGLPSLFEQCRQTTLSCQAPELFGGTFSISIKSHMTFFFFSMNTSWSRYAIAKLIVMPGFSFSYR